MMNITKYKFNCASPRLSDEELDPLEQEDSDFASGSSPDGWLPWSYDDVIDIKKIIETRMPEKQKVVIRAFLSGMSFNDIEVSEKYWRYHYQKAIEFIKKELKI
jgi:hypothetical protein